MTESREALARTLDQVLADNVRLLHEKNELVKQIIELRFELDCAYLGLKSLPRDHSAVEADLNARALLARLT